MVFGIQGANFEHPLTNSALLVQIGHTSALKSLKPAFAQLRATAGFFRLEIECPQQCLHCLPPLSRPPLSS